MQVIISIFWLIFLVFHLFRRVLISRGEKKMGENDDPGVVILVNSLNPPAGIFIFPFDCLFMMQFILSLAFEAEFVALFKKFLWSVLQANRTRLNQTEF
jgi:hypothetical protein